MLKCTQEGTRAPGAPDSIPIPPVIMASSHSRDIVPNPSSAGAAKVMKGKVLN
jgi:hypothetical protein